MRTLILIAALVATPALAQQTVRVGTGDLVTRIAYKDLKQADGRARLAAALWRSAESLCADVHPVRAAERCKARVVADAEQTALPQVARAIRMARAEADGVSLAAR